jgi:undecaprenyl-diphosphatase
MIFNVIKNSYPKSWIYLLIFVVLISYSRIYLGVHYLSDIIGGWILGFILSIIGSKYLNKFILKL